MYKSEIRPSQIQKLLEKSRKLHYEQYLYKVGLVKCRAFVNQTINKAVRTMMKLNGSTAVDFSALDFRCRG